MAQVEEQTVDVLNDVLAEDLSAVRAYQEAVDNVNETRLRSLLDELRTERASFVKDLHERVRSLGGEPVKDEDLGGSLRGMWMSLKGSLSGDEAEALLGNVEGAEESLADAYDEAIAEDIDRETQEMLMQQRTRVHSAHDRIEKLRRSMHGE
jgi:uncharacterized protein (TIGR02284 family)